jgi:hypothetical protein
MLFSSVLRAAYCQNKIKELLHFQKENFLIPLKVRNQINSLKYHPDVYLISYVLHQSK